MGYNRNQLKANAKRLKTILYVFFFFFDEYIPVRYKRKDRDKQHSSKHLFWKLKGVLYSVSFFHLRRYICVEHRKSLLIELTPKPTKREIILSLYHARARKEKGERVLDIYRKENEKKKHQLDGDGECIFVCK